MSDHGETGTAGRTPHRRPAHQHRRAGAERGAQPRRRPAAAARGPRGDPGRRRLGRRHRRRPPAGRCPTSSTVLQTRRGKGNALAAGFARVTGDIVVMFDADGSADPARDRPRSSTRSRPAPTSPRARATPAGRRLRRHHPRPQLRQPVPQRRSSTLGFRTRYTDLCYGYNAFWADLIPLLDLPDHAAPAPANGTHALGRRLRDRDGHQLPLRRGRRRRSPRCPRSRSCGSSASPTCTPSPTGSGSSRP